MPERIRPLGIVFFVLGTCLAIARFQFNYKPDFLDFKVFAFYSFYIEAKSFTIISNQMIEEIAGILMLAGLFIVACTREKSEDELVDECRLRAFFISTYLNFFFLLVSILCFFGFGFVGALTAFSLAWIAMYVLVFRILLRRAKKKILGT